MLATHYGLARWRPVGALAGLAGGASLEGGLGTPRTLARAVAGLAGVVDPALDRLAELAGLGLDRLSRMALR